MASYTGNLTVPSPSAGAGGRWEMDVLVGGAVGILQIDPYRAAEVGDDLVDRGSEVDHGSEVGAGECPVLGVRLPVEGDPDDAVFVDGHLDGAECDGDLHSTITDPSRCTPLVTGVVRARRLSASGSSAGGLPSPAC